MKTGGVKVQASFSASILKPMPNKILSISGHPAVAANLGERSGAFGGSEPLAEAQHGR